MQLRTMTTARSWKSALPAALVVVLGLLLPVPLSAQERSTEPVHHAAKVGDVDALKKILDADPDAWKLLDFTGNPPLHVAAWEGKDAAVELLLDRGADITAGGFDGWTALHFAARGGFPKTCFLLLERGAERDALSELSRTPLQGATNDEVLNLLKNYRTLRPGVGKFTSAATLGDPEELRLLLDRFPKLLDAKALNRTAVMEAAANNRIAALKLLVKRGAGSGWLASFRNPPWQSVRFRAICLTQFDPQGDRAAPNVNYCNLRVRRARIARGSRTIENPDFGRMFRL